MCVLSPVLTSDRSKGQCVHGVASEMEIRMKYMYLISYQLSIAL